MNPFTENQALAYSQVRKVYSVSAVTADLKTLLEDAFPSLWVSGEISNFKMSQSGHLYFTLKDAGAQMSAVMFKRSNRLLKFNLDSGLEVIVHGQITVYEGRGQYQIIVSHIEPKGLGALQLAFEQLKERLKREGVFDAVHKKSIPFFSHRVGIITSSKGAAVHDMITVLRRRCSNIDIVVEPVKVQGDGAVQEIAAAIAKLNKRDDIDVLIVGRGGGSLEDLWAFNEEMVVRAVFESRIPVISAVGHETDTTLCDHVADLRAPTPSAAAELAIPEKIKLLQRVDQATNALYYLLRQNLKSLKERVYFCKSQLKNPQDQLSEWKNNLELLRARLRRGLKAHLEQKKIALKEVLLPFPDPLEYIENLKAKLNQQSQFLKAYSPLNPLERGYALVFSEDEKTIVRKKEQVSQGDILHIRLADGIVKVEVTR